MRRCSACFFTFLKDEETVEFNAFVASHRGMRQQQAQDRWRRPLSLCGSAQQPSRPMALILSPSCLYSAADARAVNTALKGGTAVCKTFVFVYVNFMFFSVTTKQSSIFPIVGTRYVFLPVRTPLRPNREDESRHAEEYIFGVDTIEPVTHSCIFSDRGGKIGGDFCIRAGIGRGLIRPTACGQDTNKSKGCSFEFWASSEERCKPCLQFSYTTLAKTALNSRRSRFSRGSLHCYGGGRGLLVESVSIHDVKKTMRPPSAGCTPNFIF